MGHKPRILIVNDDGISAPGLRHLWQGLAPHADVTVVAPSEQRSGAGTGITMHHPLHVQQFQWYDGTTAYSLSGTPADCVKIALSDIMKEPPCAVFSGINNGSNAGRNVFYSGTVGATIEAALHEIPAVAISCHDPLMPTFELAEAYLPNLLEFVLASPPPKGTILNVNVPAIKGPAKGCVLATQGMSYWREVPDLRAHPEGFPYYWLGGEHAQFEEKEDSDFALIEQGYVTVVPLDVSDLTNRAYLDQAAGRFSQFFSGSFAPRTVPRDQAPPPELLRPILLPLPVHKRESAAGEAPR